MKKSLFTALALVTACSSAATASELDGSMSLGGSYSNITGQEAKANEYRAIGDGGQGSLELNWRNPEKYLDVDANLTVVDGRQANKNSATDNNLLIKGGMNDMFKLSLFYNETPHNLTNGARTFFNGVGSNTLYTDVLYNANNATLNATPFSKTFDYAIKHTKFGAEAELNLKTPFFFLARAERTETEGLQPFSFYGGSVREVPAPINYVTDNLYLQTGYRSRNLIATLDGTISNFMNQNDTFTVQQGPTLATRLPNTAYLPPDNRFYKIGGSVMYRLPLWNSTLMARGSHAIMDSNQLITEEYSAGNFANLDWNGKVRYNTINATITSNPIKKLDTRIFYSYNQRTNDGDYLNNAYYYNTSAGSPVARQGYHKQRTGLDLGYKLPAATKVSAGYEFTETNRYGSAFFTNVADIVGASPHANKTTDHLFYLQAKNNLLENVSGTLRYEHMVRSSEYELLDEQLTLAAASGNLRRAMHRQYDSAHKTMNAVKVGFDIDPTSNLNIGLQYAYKLNDYASSPTGLQDDARHELYADATYTAGIAKFNIYGELETVDANTKYFTNTGGAIWGAATNTALVNSNRKDLNYAVGTKVDVEIIKDTVKASLGYRYENADGENDLSYELQNGATVTWAGLTNMVDIGALDDYKKHSLNATVSYAATKFIDLSVSYLYENLKYTDDAYANYVNVPRGTTYALTGAYADPDYSASAVYMAMKYKF